MTEDEAKTKWCPRTIRRIEYVEPNSITAQAASCCMASECMWWVWDQYGADVDGTWLPDYPVEGHCGAIK